MKKTHVKNVDTLKIGDLIELNKKNYIFLGKHDYYDWPIYDVFDISKIKLCKRNFALLKHTLFLLEDSEE